MRPLMYIVARGEERIYEELVREFAGTDSIRVIRNRRVTQRRASFASPEAGDRRRRDRRAHPNIDADLQVLRWALVRTTED